MKDYIVERVLELSQYMIDTGATVRAAAQKFNVSKSTVHKDLSERLPQIHHGMNDEIKEVLKKNKSERHIRGGNATKEKYAKHR